ncbi:MAG TPA: hypothetical protein PLI20_06850 [Bacillota bacterium]|nr:hypothetical protein [Bacillota bacterium]
MKIDLSAADNIRSPIAEAFRSFRTNIQFFNVDKPIKSLVVYNEPRKQDRQNRENKLEWDHGKETKFYT